MEKQIHAASFREDTRRQLSISFMFHFSLTSTRERLPTVGKGILKENLQIFEETKDLSFQEQCFQRSTKHKQTWQTPLGKNFS